MIVTGGGVFALEMRPHLRGRSRRAARAMVLEDGPEISFWRENVAKNANGHATAATGGAGTGTGGDGPAHDTAKFNTVSRGTEFAVCRPKTDRV